jgi:5-methylcytosine-specific restriction endonuclease McrA
MLYFYWTAISLILEGNAIMECKYCGKLFRPTNTQCNNRIAALEGRIQGEAHFYCSDNCRSACPIFGKVLYTEGYAPATSNEVPSWLRHLVFKRDDYTCQICGAKENLHCHHYEPQKIQPMMAADAENCTALCADCHIIC